MTGFPMPTNRLPTIFLAAGAAVLLLAILLGERMGDTVLGQVARGNVTLPGRDYARAASDGRPVRPGLEALDDPHRGTGSALP